MNSAIYSSRYHSQYYTSHIYRTKDL